MVAHHRTIDRIARILEVVSGKSQGMTLTEITDALQEPKSSIQGFVNGLVATGFLDRQGLRYLLGPAPYILTLRANRMPARSVTHEDLVRLAAEGNFTVTLAVRVGDDSVLIDEVGEHPWLQYLARTRFRLPLLETVSGRVILAALGDDELHEFLATHPRQDLVKQFLDEISAIQATGVATSIATDIVPRVGYPGTGTGVVGAAVRNHAGDVVGAVLIGQDPEYFKENLDEMIKVLQRHTSHWASRQSPPLADDIPSTFESMT